jgi:hypothetical protein
MNKLPLIGTGVGVLVGEGSFVGTLVGEATASSSGVSRGKKVEVAVGNMVPVGVGVFVSLMVGLISIFEVLVKGSSVFICPST